MRGDPVQRKIREKAVQRLQYIDETYHVSAAWIAEQLGVAQRSVPRWRKGHSVPQMRQALKIQILQRALDSGKIQGPDWRCEYHGRPASNGSGYKGVFWHGPSGLFSARVSTSWNILGYFPLPEQAALVYNIAARKAFGACAFQNELPEMPQHACHKCGIRSRLAVRILLWDTAVVARSNGVPGRCESVWCCQKCKPSRAFFEYDREFYEAGGR